MLEGDRPIGVVTSGAHGHRTGRTLALAYLRPGASGDGMSVLILGEHAPARVLTEAPYDAGNHRMRGAAEAA